MHGQRNIKLDMTQLTVAPRNFAKAPKNNETAGITTESSY